MTWPSKILLGMIWLYQHSFSAFMGRRCRYYPSCSAYTAGAIRRFGAAKGAAMGVWRICRCNPWSRGGHDPVPQEFSLKFFSKKPGCCDRNLGT